MVLRRPSIPWPIFTHKKKRSGRPGSILQALPTKASSSKERKFNTTMPKSLVIEEPQIIRGNPAVHLSLQGKGGVEKA